MSDTLQSAPLGIMSTATLEYTLTTSQAEKTTFIFVSTFNAANPNQPYQFKSESERLASKLGKIRFATCGTNGSSY